MSETPKFDPTKPCRTRDGRKVEILRTDLNNHTYPIAGIITDHDGEQYPHCWTSDGWYFAHGPKSGRDIVNIPRKVTRWVPLWGDGCGGFFTGRTQTTKEMAEADGRCMKSFLGVYEITHEVP